MSNCRTGDKKVLTKEFWRRTNVYRAEKEILLPQIEYLTNDAWDLLSCMSQGNGYPMLLEADYAKGVLYVLAVPDNFADLYALPAEVLTIIKEVMTARLARARGRPCRREFVCLRQQHVHRGVVPAQFGGSENRG